MKVCLKILINSEKNSPEVSVRIVRRRRQQIADNSTSGILFAVQNCFFRFSQSLIFKESRLWE